MWANSGSSWACAVSVSNQQGYVGRLNCMGRAGAGWQAGLRSLSNYGPARPQRGTASRLHRSVGERCSSRETWAPAGPRSNQHGAEERELATVTQTLGEEVGLVLGRRQVSSRRTHSHGPLNSRRAGSWFCRPGVVILSPFIVFLSARCAVARSVSRCLCRIAPHLLTRSFPTIAKHISALSKSNANKTNPAHPRPT
uniref:Uncharacterized protein n=1 Tax=Branchiostoma floridae TaxID=7739 RepID=C3ZZ51_BRAFL|eukprot:XP_002586151.1 hypothetical protein BRAFLDRAFT_109848 [Branchiostoma floridae]